MRRPTQFTDFIKQISNIWLGNDKNKLQNWQFKGISTKAEELARAYIKNGKYSEAEGIYLSMIAEGTMTYITYAEYGALCGMQGDIKKMKFYSEKALLLNKNYAVAHNNLGYALQTFGQPKESKQSYKLAIELKPNYADAYFNLGNIELTTNQPLEAVKCYRKAIELNKLNWQYYLNLGKALQKISDQSEAALAYSRAVELNPKDASAYIALAKLMENVDEFSKAKKLYKTATIVSPGEYSAYFYLGNLFAKENDMHNAIASFNTALKLKPNCIQTLMNLGNAYKESDQQSLAKETYRMAISLSQPLVNPDIFYNLGLCYHSTGEIQNAIYAHKKALKIHKKPKYHFGLAISLLLSGNLANGLNHYESRVSLEELDPNLNFFVNSGIHKRIYSIDSNRILVVCEQGLGDTLHCIRYVKVLQKLHINYQLCVQPKLASLVKTSGLDISPITLDEAKKIKSSSWVPLLSLLKYLQVKPEKSYAPGEYIRTSEDLVLKWKKHLAKNTKPIIGINWQGNRKDSYGINRNVDISNFKSIMQSDKFTFVSLQRGVKKIMGLPQWLKNCYISEQARIDTLADSNNPEDFLEYAAVVASCDLIITTATTVAHLAGAMGKHTWVLVPRVPDWKWGLEQKTTCWYPKTKLFRQDNTGSWSSAIEGIHKEMKYKFDYLYDSENKS